jgi:ligand-binding sensor domain-containing protein
MIQRTLGSLLLMILTSVVCQAQLPAISFEVISSKNGLPGNTVLSATRDHKGFMWFGTRQDVVRYNGATFQRYTSPETNFVTRVVADDDNNIWLSSDRNGVCRIDAYTQQMECMPQTQESDIETVGFFYIDRNKNGWYSDRSGVTRMNLKTRERKHYPFKQTTFVWTKASFVEDVKGTLWIIGRDNGLFRYDRERDVVQCMWGADCDASPASPEQILLSSTSVADDDGTLWIGSYNAGLIHYNPTTNTFKKYPTHRRSNQVNSIARGTDENGRAVLWIGDNQGLGIFRPGQQKFYFFPDILPNPYEVNYIYRDDKEGIVWVCTSEGIIKYNPLSNVIRSFMLPPGMVANPVTINVVLPDNQYQNIVYLGLSHTGIVQWNKVSQEFTLIRYPEGGETKWMTQRADGTLWIGTNRWDFKRPGLLVYNTDQE